LDNEGFEYEVILGKIGGNQIKGTICNTKRIAEPKVRITIYQALLKSDRFEFVLQKCTEIGVSAFVPIVCERCVVKKISANKLVRWQKIIKEAAEQSGRSILPVLKNAVSFNDACHSIEGLSLIAGITSESLRLSEVLRLNTPKHDSITLNIFIGPEGGFTEDELESAQRCGIQRITLGPHVLRAETAGIVAATAILYEYGELDRPSPDIKL